MLSPSIKRKVLDLIAHTISDGRRALSEPEAKQLLSLIGITVPRAEVVSISTDACAAANRVGVPVVVKAISSVLTHKTDLGAVIFPVESGDAAKAACEVIAARIAQCRPGLTLDGFLIEAYRPARVEWILSLRFDPSFGPVIMFGLGGIFVEVLNQVSFRLAPLQDRDIEALMREQPSTRIFASIRGAPPADLVSLKNCLRALSDLTECGEIAVAISEIEINPLTVSEDGVLALDAAVILR